MTTQKRLSKPRHKGMTIVEDGDVLVYDLFHKISEVEEALLLAGAKPGTDYTFMDLVRTATDLYKGAELTAALNKISKALFDLGFGGTDRPGAIEGHTMHMDKAMQGISSAISEGLGAVADALRDTDEI